MSKFIILALTDLDILNIYPITADGASAATVMEDTNGDRDRDRVHALGLAVRRGADRAKLGTALGSGCTSGHGVCGLARLSGRSLAAVVTFMAAGFVTVFVLRHILGGA